MKAIIIYSGKGGVGKTTTTANIARLLAKQGNKVFIIDADINTPSMNTEFEGDHPHEMIWVHSSGNMFSKFNEFQKIVDEIVQSDIVVLEEYSTENGYDENFDVTDIHITGSRKHYFTHELKYDNGVEKTLTLPAMKFLSVRTWDKVRDYIRFHDDLGHLWDERMRRCDTERVGRVVNHFQNDDNAYFMVINAPNTEVHLITGEIGICSLLTGQRGHFELPRVSYQTSKGNVVLFPDEIMPVDINLLQQEINEGYIMLSDGRYLPPKETVQQCYNAFGIRVGLGDNWEDIYDSWNKEMK